MTPRGKVGVLILITTATRMMAASNDLLILLGQVLRHFHHFIQHSKQLFEIHISLTLKLSINGESLGRHSTWWGKVPREIKR